MVIEDQEVVEEWDPELEWLWEVWEVWQEACFWQIHSVSREREAEK